MSMSPSSVASLYLSERIVCEQYEQQMKRVAGRIGGFTAAEINQYLKSRQSSVTLTTVANERRLLRTLWQYAYDQSLVDQPPRAMLRIPKRVKPVEAWSVADVQHLVNIAEQRPGRFRCGIAKSLYLKTWVLLAYCTGARYGDVFEWTPANIRRGAVQWTIHKTGVSCVRVLSPECQQAVAEMLVARKKCGLPVNGPILGGVCCRRYSFKVMRKLLEECELPGSGRYLRRSSCTHVEMQQPGAGQVFLAHRSPGMAARHYIDATQLQSQVPTPPRLVTAG